MAKEGFNPCLWGESQPIEEDETLGADGDRHDHARVVDSVGQEEEGDGAVQALTEERRGVGHALAEDGHDDGDGHMQALAEDGHDDGDGMAHGGVQALAGIVHSLADTVQSLAGTLHALARTLHALADGGDNGNKRAKYGGDDGKKVRDLSFDDEDLMAKCYSHGCIPSSGQQPGILVGRGEVNTDTGSETIDSDELLAGTEGDQDGHINPSILYVPDSEEDSLPPPVEFSVPEGAEDIRREIMSIYLPDAL